MSSTVHKLQSADGKYYTRTRLSLLRWPRFFNRIYECTVINNENQGEWHREGGNYSVLVSDRGDGGLFVFRA